jgi:hypothetical protein
MVISIELPQLFSGEMKVTCSSKHSFKIAQRARWCPSSFHRCGASIEVIIIGFRLLKVFGFKLFKGQAVAASGKQQVRAVCLGCTRPNIADGQ